MNRPVACSVCGGIASHLCTRCGSWLCESRICEAVAIGRIAVKVTGRAVKAVQNSLQNLPLFVEIERGRQPRLTRSEGDFALPLTRLDSTFSPQILSQVKCPKWDDAHHL